MSTRTKLQRGQKICPKCKEINASRQYVCKYCKHQFVSKNTPVKNEVKNWKELEIGTYIKVVQGTGPYYISKRDTEDGSAGERICMGNTGVYKVAGFAENGIHAYGASYKDSGYSFLYMGQSKRSKDTGIYYEPHRIKKVNKRRRKNG